MPVLSDYWIDKYGKDIIDPYVGHLEQEGIISYGLTSGGYDLRLANKFKLFRNYEHRLNRPIIDPKNFSHITYDDIQSEILDIPPHSFTLAMTEEYIKMPLSVMGFMQCKSTYARCGIVMPPTVIEPEWEGRITLEIANVTNLPVRLYAHEGICQLVFMKLDEIPMTTYSSRGGKYNKQTEITLPRIKNGR